MPEIFDKMPFNSLYSIYYFDVDVDVDVIDVVREEEIK
jgi:hypothetical protein